MIEQTNEQPMLPTKDQWSNWKDHPCSRWYFHALQKEFQTVTEDVVMGATINTGSVDETALATTRALSTAKTLYMVGRASYEDVCDMLDIELSTEEGKDGEDHTEGYESIG